MPIDVEPPEPPPLLIEAVVADVVGAHATESPGHGTPIHTHCENCDTALNGPYCHRCGQHDFDFQRSFGHMFLDALENFFHFDTKLFRNVVTLLFYPGRLTAEFNAGKRAAQMPPLRLYIFVSLVFFLLVFANKKFPDAWVLDEGDLKPRIVSKVDGQPAAPADALLAAAQNLTDGSTGEGKRDAKELRDLVAGLKEAKARAVAAKKAAGKKPLQLDGSENSAILRWIEEQGRSMAEPAHRKEVIEAFFHSLPKMLLFCLPFFALYTRVLFRQSGQVYLQHLVVALHFHTFVFLWLMFRDGWVFLAGLLGPGLAGWLRFACNVWLYIYPVVMLRRLFANSWKRTIFKSLVLAFVYEVTLGLGFVVTALIVFLML